MAPTNYRQWTDAWAEVTRLTHAVASRGRCTRIRAAGSGSCSGRPCSGCSSSTSSRSSLLLMTSLWQQDVFTAELVRKWTLDNYDKLFTGQDGLWLRVFGRTVLLAAIVTLIDIALAFPLAWFMARVASPKWRTLLFLAVVVPLWSSILVRIFAWRTILGGQGVLN